MAAVSNGTVVELYNQYLFLSVYCPPYPALSLSRNDQDGDLMSPLE